jgi:ribosome biogenesis protein ERB1
LPAQPAKSKKRAVEEVADESEDEEFEVDGAELDFGEEEDGDDEAAEDESDDDEAFPELDSGSEDGEEAGDLASDADTEEEEDLDDEESGSESGYNTSDIEAMYSSAPTSPESTGKELSVDEKLSRMVAKNTVKPDERIGSDLKISDAKEGTGKLRPSKLVPGGYLREYDDIEAGYGSESSTEDVSFR